MSAVTILIVDDEAPLRESLMRGLAAVVSGVELLAAGDGEQALSMLKRSQVAVLILDLSLNEREGVESGYKLLQSAQTHSPLTRCIVLTGNSSVEYGVRALERGAAHFLAKPADLQHLAALVRDSIDQYKIRCSLKDAHEKEPNTLLRALVGSSPKIQELRRDLYFAAQTPQSIFLSGETGTGKGLCARLIHDLGLRKEKRFARYQPIFGSPDLINSDLFGHRRGAFTGALEDRIGMIELCDDGTFFLDEIDELPRETQIVLLGVLQERSFRRIGESEERMIRVRFVSASNADIQAKIKDGTFRNDLFHRIAQVEIRIPPLRDRLSDIQELTEHILSFAQTSVGLPLLLVSPEAVRVLQSHHWPGNVRELESVVQAAGWRTFQRGDTEIRATDIRLNARAPLCEDVSNRSFRDQVRAFEQKLIDEALTRNGQNISAVARELGIDRGTIRKIRGGEG